MRIIFIPGILTYKWRLNAWKQDLRTIFSQDEIIFFDDQIYVHLENDKLEEIVERGVSLISDEKPTLILAHSYGGILAKTIISRAKKHCVKKLITMASPHQMKFFFVKESKEKLKVPQELDIPIISFGGYLDLVVPYWFTSTDKSVHTNLQCHHLGFLFNKKIREIILQEIKKSID